MEVLCPKGHKYDNSLSACPFCFPGQARPVNQNPNPSIGVTTPINFNSNLSPTAPINPGFAPQQQNPLPPTQPVKSTPIDDGKTQVLTQLETKTRVRPVVGWLVCVEGNDIGKDFRLHTDRNTVGRDSQKDVSLDDKAVSREHFSIFYDKINNRYFASLDAGQQLVYINGFPLSSGMTQLRKGDQIQVAHTTLVFIPLEQQDVKWNWKQ